MSGIGLDEAGEREKMIANELRRIMMINALDKAVESFKKERATEAHIPLFGPYHISTFRVQFDKVMILR